MKNTVTLILQLHVETEKSDATHAISSALYKIATSQNPNDWGIKRALVGDSPEFKMVVDPPTLYATTQEPESPHRRFAVSFQGLRSEVIQPPVVFYEPQS